MANKKVKRTITASKAHPNAYKVSPGVSATSKPKKRKANDTTPPPVPHPDPPPPNP